MWVYAIEALLVLLYWQAEETVKNQTRRYGILCIYIYTVSVRFFTVRFNRAEKTNVLFNNQHHKRCSYPRCTQTVTFIQLSNNSISDNIVYGTALKETHDKIPQVETSVRAVHGISALGPYKYFSKIDLHIPGFISFRFVKPSEFSKNNEKSGPRPTYAYLNQLSRARRRIFEHRPPPSY